MRLEESTLTSEPEISGEYTGALNRNLIEELHRFFQSAEIETLTSSALSNLKHQY